MKGELLALVLDACSGFSVEQLASCGEVGFRGREMEGGLQDADQ